MEEITPENMHVHLGYLCRKIDKLSNKMDKEYITRMEFDPIKKIVYGVVMLILAGVVAGVIRML